MRKFDTKVQLLKYNVLKEVARNAFEDTLVENISHIPKEILPNKEASMRCCVYKERAILAERVKLAIGGNKNNRNVIEVIDIACDECPVGGHVITSSCRGCISHHCKEVCPKKAVKLDHNKRTYIDKSLCIECGLCAKVCPFNAIANYKRPCENACKIKAITMNKYNYAEINNEKCIACGACIYQCPFGAIMDKSFILNIIDMLKKSAGNGYYRVYAVIAPSIVSQFGYASVGQVVSGLKKLGFYKIAEAALGADMVAFEEAKELKEKGFLTSSCCPAFVDFINKRYPEISGCISKRLSPMATIAKHIKQKDPKSKIVFIGPCTAKKMEFQKQEVREYVDSVMTFEELQAVFDGCNIDISALEEENLKTSSYFGRIFARSAGLSEAVGESLKEQNISDFEFLPEICDGIESCNAVLSKISKNLKTGNFIEGMACSGGCIGGAGSVSCRKKNPSSVDKYAVSGQSSISSALEMQKRENTS